MIEVVPSMAGRPEHLGVAIAVRCAGQGSALAGRCAQRPFRGDPKVDLEEVPTLVRKMGTFLKINSGAAVGPEPAVGYRPGSLRPLSPLLAW
jgi:hypothetical protein